MGGGRGRPLHERVRPEGPGATRPAAPAPPAGGVEAPGGTGRSATPGVATTGAGRHCWVTVPVDGPRERPGLLLEWRAVGRGRWEGRVVYAAELRPGRWAVVEEWLPAEYLAPRE